MLASMLAFTSALMDASAETDAPPGSSENSAANPADTSISGRMQNFSLSMNQSPNSSITTGRNSSNTNDATIVMSGIEKEQISRQRLSPVFPILPSCRR